jgi:segregation and condensation protein A
VAEAGARLAIRLLQDAAERGEIDPWDVDVIGVVDGFLDQLRQRIALPRLAAVSGGSFEQDLAESSEAFLAASVLVGLKAEVLEAATFPPEPIFEDAFDCEDGGEPSTIAGLALPRRPERHLLRRPVAPPPLPRPVSRGELVRQTAGILERPMRVDRHGIATRRQGPHDRRAHASFTAGDERHAACLRGRAGDESKRFVHGASPGSRAGRHRPFGPDLQIGGLITYACGFMVS